MPFPTGSARWPAFAICLIAAACGPRPNFVPFETYASGESAIYGYVTDLYSCGLEGAAVRIQGSDGSLTNGSGQYRIRVMSGESYALTASIAGFTVDSISLDVGSEPLRHDFSLVPAPDCPDGNCRAYRPPCRLDQLPRQ